MVRSEVSEVAVAVAAHEAAADLDGAGRVEEMAAAE